MPRGKGFASRRVDPDKRKRSIKASDKRMTEVPRSEMLSVRVSPEERQIIKTYFGSLARLRDFAVASTDGDADIRDYMVFNIDAELPHDKNKG